ncbi:MAG TPA: hypothetical protein DDW73_01820 [Rhizobium sp.]|nr:hypothetical protein [Rhizobium sp.]
MIFVMRGQKSSITCKNDHKNFGAIPAIVANEKTKTPSPAYPLLNRSIFLKRSVIKMGILAIVQKLLP